MMKIFNAMFSKVNGGLEQVFLNYTPALALQGNEVIPVIHPKAEVADACPQKQLRKIHNFNQYDLFAVYRLKRLIAQEQPDCIITHSYRAAYLFSKTKTQVPTIAVCHVQGHYHFGTDAIIAITESMREEIIASGIPAHTVFTVPNMLSLPSPFLMNPPKNKTVPTIGVCARFVSMKGIDVFLAALSELKKQGLSFIAKIAGDGPERETYLGLIHQYQLENEVYLLGWVSDTDSFYQDLDIFCLPSRKEAFGLVILEAMKHALPMVLSDLPGPKEIIADTDSALFFPSEDSCRLAHCLAQLIQNKELRQTLAERAFLRIQHYSMKQIGPKLQQVLQQVCAQKATSR